MVMRYGRQDCGDSPREQAEDFPNPRMGLDGVLSWCSRVFDFSDRECVAILGMTLCGKALGVLLLLISRSETFTTTGRTSQPLVWQLAYLLFGIEISPRQTLQTNYWYESSLSRAKVCGPNKALCIGTFEKREDKTINIIFCYFTGSAHIRQSSQTGVWL
mgnify:FL=1